MKILIVNTLYFPYKTGGAEVSVQILAEGLVAKGHTVKVVCLHQFDTLKEDMVNGVEISYLPLLNKYWPFDNYRASKLERSLWHVLDTYNFWMAKKVENEIQKFRPDIVHTNNLTGFSVAVWDKVKKNKIPLIHTSRDYYLFNPNTTLFKNGKVQSVSSLEVKIWSWVKRKVSKKVDYFVGISNFITEFHLSNGFFKGEKFSYTVYNPVKKIKKEKINKNIKNVGFIGKLMTEKGFDTFCDFVEKNGEKYVYYAAGNPANNYESQKLYDRAKKLGVILLGHVSFEEFIQKVDAVILPIKWNEPFGRVVVECAMAGIKVFVSDKGGVSELISKFDNINILKDSLFIDDNITNYTETKEFETESNVDKYIDIYSRLINVN